MTLDGFCDHTAIIPDEEMHNHYADLLSDADAVLYGRVTYQLMEYWRDELENSTGNKAMDHFAIVMNNTPKIVFSHTLRNIEWESAKLTKRDVKEEVLELKQQKGKDILAGSPSLIVTLTKLNLIDEYQLCVHPIIAGSGLPLFKGINDKVDLKLIKTKTFAFGAIVFYYKQQKDEETLIR